MHNKVQSLDFNRLRERYLSSNLKPTDVVKIVLERIEKELDKAIWITLLPKKNIITAAEKLSDKDPKLLPLYGLPFAIKDNIDFAGFPTTAACPEYEYLPVLSAPVVDILIAAGAILIGKTNMDQFATGLVGTRSPYGSCSNAFDPKYISGGSSAGSAVAVSAGLVSFSLGTDTAGSGRVPASFNNIVGLKASRGLISTRGVVPACRTLDCVSIFALNVADAYEVLDVVSVFDKEDAFSRKGNFKSKVSSDISDGLKIGVPAKDDLKFFGNHDYERLFAEALNNCAELGAEIKEVDFTPFYEVARLLYEGPWVAERYQAIRKFFDQKPESLHPVIHEIIGGGIKITAAEAFAADYRLRELRRIIEPVWSNIDMMLMPTAGTIYTKDEVEKNPVELNSYLGTYTNFMNLLDLCGVSIPAGFQKNNLPFGITIAAPAFYDYKIQYFADLLHRRANTGMGAKKWPLPDLKVRRKIDGMDTLTLAVCGAHMSGLPLNTELIERGATLIRTCKSAKKYRFYALEDFMPPRPGMVRSSATVGFAIDLELWSVPISRFGEFIAGIPSPLGIGSIELDDGSIVKGFICESYAVQGARDISKLGSWRKYISMS